MPSRAPVAPLNLQDWIRDHRELLRPPVGNKLVFPAGDFIVMVVGGPNARKDYHVDAGAEFFHQLEGTLELRTVQDGARVDYHVGPGEVFLLPPDIPHCPVRPAASIGLVVERRRLPTEQDGFQWYCERCNALLYAESFMLTDIERQFEGLFARFYGSLERRTCRDCGEVMEPPAGTG